MLFPEEHGQKCILSLALLRSGCGQNQAKLSERTAPKGSLWSHLRSLGVVFLPPTAFPWEVRDHHPASQQETPLYLDGKAVLWQWCSCYSSRARRC